MKKTLFLTVALCCAIIASAQPNNKFIGSWEGILNIGMEVRAVFNIKDDGKGGYISTADSPDQSTYGIACDKTTVNGDNIKIEINALNATFNGKLINDTTIEGSLLQGMEIPLTLKKKLAATPQLNRPQTPQPPFPYKSEDIVYDSKDKSMQYGATITIPEGKGPFPAAILITGSGAQDRDETIGGHKLFAILADYLTRRGFVILRVDDRSVGKTTGKFEESTSADFAKDANVGLDYLLSRPEVNKKKLGIIGHSEGGMIAPMIAVGRKDIDFIVLLAGPGAPIMDLMVLQNQKIYTSGGMNEAAVQSYLPLYRDAMLSIIDSPDTTTAINSIREKTNQWSVGKDASVLKELKLGTAADRDVFATTFVQQVYSPWFRYFMSFEPAKYLEKLDSKVLAINGDKDLQVDAKQNLTAIEAALKKSKSKKYTIKEIPGQNHLFQTCKLCTLNEYGKLEESFSTSTLQVIGDWLSENVK